MPTNIRKDNKKHVENISNITKTCQKYSKNMAEIYQQTYDIPNNSWKKHITNIGKTCSKYANTHLKTYLKKNLRKT